MHLSTGPATMVAWRYYTLGGPARRSMRRAGMPRELLRGRRVRPLGRGEAPDRGRVGDRGAGSLPAGKFLDQAVLHPRPVTDSSSMFGDVWQWTSSAYAPYPGFRPASGAVGEYNGKFMVNQYVLRGGSCVTPEGHVQADLPQLLPAVRQMGLLGPTTGARRLTWRRLSPWNLRALPRSTYT